VEGDDDDPRNIDILETKGCHEVQGPSIEDPNIIASLKTKKVNIGTEAELKYARLADYWHDAYRTIPELAIPTDLPVGERIHRLASGFREAKEEETRIQLDLNLQIVEL